jgi:hypothetical protein
MNKAMLVKKMVTNRYLGETRLKVKTYVFWNVAPYNVVAGQILFGLTTCLDPKNSR